MISGYEMARIGSESKIMCSPKKNNILRSSAAETRDDDASSLVTMQYKHIC